MRISKYAPYIYCRAYPSFFSFSQIVDSINEFLTTTYTTAARHASIRCSERAP